MWRSPAPHSLTWSELLQRADAVAGGLAALGVRRGDAVAMMLGNRPEFHVVDLGVATLGALVGYRNRPEETAATPGRTTRR